MPQFMAMPQHLNGAGVSEMPLGIFQAQVSLLAGQRADVSIQDHAGAVLAQGAELSLDAIPAAGLGTDL